MSNEKILKEELAKKLKEYELNDENLDTVAGGVDATALMECIQNDPRYNASNFQMLFADCHEKLFYS